MTHKKSRWIYKITILMVISTLIIFFINKESNIKEDNSNLLIETEEDILVSEKLEEERLEAEKKEAEERQRLEEIKNDPFMVLINGDNLLTSDFVPNDLVELDVKFQNYINEKNLNIEAAKAVKEMFNAALLDGITLIGASGYRSYELQSILFETRVAQIGEVEASKYIAVPGASEHQLGLAIDIVSNEYQYLEEAFENTEAFKWLMDNAYKYGFILRYLKGKEDITGYNYEPWHFRYIGDSEVAKYIMENNLTFEEFHEEIDIKLEE